MHGGGGGLVAKLCPTLAILWTEACQAPLSMGFSRQEYWSGLPFPSPGDLPDPGIEPGSPELQADDLPTELWGKPRHTVNCIKDHVSLFPLADRKLAVQWQCIWLYDSKCMCYARLSCFGVSNSVWPHRLQPARLLCPWDSPGKNTGVNCCALLHGIFPVQGSNTSFTCPALKGRFVFLSLAPPGKPSKCIGLYNI